MDFIITTLSEGFKLAWITLVLLIIALMYGIVTFSTLAINILVFGFSPQVLILATIGFVSLSLAEFVGMLLKKIVVFTGTTTMSLFNSHISSVNHKISSGTA